VPFARRETVSRQSVSQLSGGARSLKYYVDPVVAGIVGAGRKIDGAAVGIDAVTAN
jgi:hypothetical protein